MQTILGASGQIANELAKELKRHYTADIRLVSRNPKQVNPTDKLMAANLLDFEQTSQAVAGSEIVYLTVGLPMDTPRWVAEFPQMMRNSIDACKQHGAKLVFFDNTYMYPQDSRVLTEDTAFAPVGKKGEIRQQITEMLLAEMDNAESGLQAAIVRAPEFYGAGATKSITNGLIFARIHRAKEPQVLLRDDTLRTLIWTPDASRAMARIGNTPDSYGQTWHLPCDDERLTYQQMLVVAEEIYGKKLPYKILDRATMDERAKTSDSMRELQELLPRYEHDNLFDSTKFKVKFPDFVVTSYKEGIQQIKAEAGQAGS